MTPLVETRNLVKEFQLPGGWFTGAVKKVRAVDGVSLEIEPGQVFGLVGESGCGKTTLGRMILRLVDISDGQVIFDGNDLTHMNNKEMRILRRQMQIVFQNPFSSLSPRLKVEEILREPFQTHPVIEQNQVRSTIIELLRQVGLGEQHLDRFPHELSGGQCQRVAIARAIALNPRMIVLDEPTSALDVSVQAQIINLLQELRAKFGLTFLFITHDLSVIEHVSDQIGVMYMGKLVEIGPSEKIFEKPLHPYTSALLGSIPVPEVGKRREMVVLKGSIPSLINPPSGCRFHTRCPLAEPICQEIEPPLIEIQTQRHAACHFITKIN
jgi:oligopeptide/dipeptide ABC transporter ATP-binding protein